MSFSTNVIVLEESEDNDGSIIASSADQSTAKERKRVSTDGYFLLFHAIFLGALACLMTYCIYNGDLDRITRGYDNCKNICGMKNFVRDDLRVDPCEGLDMRMRPFLVTFKPDGRNFYKAFNTGQKAIDIGVSQILAGYVARVCVVNCKIYPNYEPFGNRCILKKRKEVSDRFFGKMGFPNFFLEFAEDLELCWQKILYLGIFSFALSFIISVLFSILTGAMVWLILNATVLLSLVFTVYMWILWAETKQIINEPEYLPQELEMERYITYLAFALIGTFSIPLFVFIIFNNRKRMELVIQLYKEAIRAISAMRLLLLQPLLTCAFVSLICSVWVYSTLWIESSGKEKRVYVQLFIYKKDPLIRLTRWCNIFTLFWMVKFILDCQHMVVAGAVSFWYFCRNKNNLGIPIFYGLYNSVRYHLGSLSLGSLLTALVKIPRLILMLVQKYFKTKEEEFSAKRGLWYLRWRDNILKYFTRDAFVEVVIYGYAFRPAGKQAFKILSANYLSIACFNNMGSFVLVFAKIFISIVAILLGAVILQDEDALLHMWAILVLSGFYAYLISSCFFSLYESITDTIFLCFCEDCEHHDGLSKPYFMSPEFLAFVQNCRKFFVVPGKDENTRKIEAWNSELHE